MTARRRNPHVRPVGSEPERILGNSRAATADNMPINEPAFLAALARISRVDGLWRDNYDALPEEAEYENVEDKPHLEGIEEEEQMPEIESGYESGYCGPTDDNVRCLIRKALEEHEETRLKRVIDDRCRNMVLELSEEANEQSKRNIHTPVFEVMEQTAVRAFFTGGPDESLDEKMYKLAESQDPTQCLVRNLIKSSTFTVPATRFVEQQAKQAVASETKFQQDVRREFPVKKEDKPRSALTDRTPESSETYEDDYQDKKRKDKTPSHH